MSDGKCLICGGEITTGGCIKCNFSDYKSPIPHKCPCCDGFGERDTPSGEFSLIVKKECISCEGSGIVWYKE